MAQQHTEQDDMQKSAAVFATLLFEHIEGLPLCVLTLADEC